VGVVPSSDLHSVERSLEQLFRLAMGRRTLARQSEAVGAEVSRAGYAVLRTLGDSGAITMGALARHCAMDPAVAARQVGSLEQKALVRTAGDANDGRVRIVELTDHGADVLSSVVELRTAFLARALRDWSDDQRGILVDVVDRLVEDLQSVPFGAEVTT
jgi:DNA-binding MarR family transcriptional regulator